MTVKSGMYGGIKVKQRCTSDYVELENWQARFLKMET